MMAIAIIRRELSLDRQLLTDLFMVLQISDSRVFSLQDLTLSLRYFLVARVSFSILFASNVFLSVFWPLSKGSGGDADDDDVSLVAGDAGIEII